MRPGLTLVCITKDQAGKLLRMLESVQGVVDDIVVVDTGSKDLSLGVAKTQGARVFQIDWPGSFSVALNSALEQVETEWTLRLDTDEWLLPESGPQIRKLTENDSASGYYLLRQDLSDEDHFSEAWMHRLWRTHPQMRYKGFIHEYFPDDALTRASGTRKIFRAPIRFRHDGYIGGNDPARHRRNIDLLRKELEVNPGDLYYECELAMTMLIVAEPGAAEMIDRLANDLVGKYSQGRPDPFTANLLGTAITQIPRRDLKSARTETLIDRSWQWFDACPPMLWAIAQAELRRTNPAGMYRALLRLEELSDSGEYEREWTFDSRMLGESLWENLARVAESLGHKDVAERNWLRLGPPIPLHSGGEESDPEGAGEGASVEPL